jgi:hypothetical protein
MIIVSLVQIGFYFLLSYISNIFNVVDSSIINYEGGLTPVLFALNTFFYLFEHDYFNEYNIFLFVFGKGKYSSFTMLIVLYFFTPNRTFMGNLSGIFAAYFIRKIFLCFLPRISWIIEFEWAFGLNKKGTFYRNITSENAIMKSILNQIEPNSVSDMDMGVEKQEENNNVQQINNNDNNNNEAHQSIIEMSSLSNNNNNINNNNEYENNNNYLNNNINNKNEANEILIQLENKINDFEIITNRFKELIENLNENNQYTKYIILNHK